MRAVLQVSARLESCGCEDGCLSCVHMAGCGEYNEGLDKKAAQAVLQWLLRGERPGETESPAGGVCLPCTASEPPAASASTDCAADVALSQPSG